MLLSLGNTMLLFTVGISCCVMVRLRLPFGELKLLSVVNLATALCMHQLSQVLYSTASMSGSRKARITTRKNTTVKSLRVDIRI